jgi:hypothetical protein
MTVACVHTLLDVFDTWLLGLPGLTPSSSARRNSGVHQQKYILDDTMQFTGADGASWSLDELIAEAKARGALGEDFRITGSFLNEPDSKGSLRCRVRWSKLKGLSITDYHTSTTYRDGRGLPGDPELDKAANELFKGEQ